MLKQLNMNKSFLHYRSFDVDLTCCDTCWRHCEQDGSRRPRGRKIRRRRRGGRSTECRSRRYCRSMEGGPLHLFYCAARSHVSFVEINYRTGCPVDAPGPRPLHSGANGTARSLSRSKSFAAGSQSWIIKIPLLIISRFPFQC